MATIFAHADWMRSNEQGPALVNVIRCARRELRRLIDTTPERLHAGAAHAEGTGVHVHHTESELPLIIDLTRLGGTLNESAERPLMPPSV